MSGPQSPISAQASHAVTQIVPAIQQSTAATLMAAIVAAANRPHSVQEVLDIQRDVLFSLYPNSTIAAFKGWHESNGDRLEKAHT